MKTFKQLMEEVPTNNAGDASAQRGGPMAGLGSEPVKGASGPIARRKKPKFAGCEVFEVTPEDYAKCLNGRMRYERWSKRLNMEDNDDIRSYAHKNPTLSVIVQNSQTGEMSYLMKR
tara:strand:+ start:709 stop:1059 length:351 start_codon:yes stop_codon:yes gene_type:complete